MAKLYVCGTRGSFPTFGKEFEIYGQGTTCYVLKDGNYAIMMDCGSGIANAAECLKDCNNIDVILTHVHYDHIMGLYMPEIPFLGKRVTFYGNFDAWKNVRGNEKNEQHHFWPEIIERYPTVCVRDGMSCNLSKGYRVSFKLANHGNGAMMITIEKDGKKLCFTGDNEYVEEQNLEKWSVNSDILIFDGSYNEEQYQTHRGWGHSYWEKGCELAKTFHIKKLVITHFSPDEDDTFLKKEEEKAKKIFSGCEFAKEQTSMEF